MKQKKPATWGRCRWKLILTIHGEANTEHSSQLYVNCHVIICNQKNTQPRGAGYINLFGLG